MKKIDSFLEEITQKLVYEFNPEKIFLFGSYAWGLPHEDSDLDLFILVKDSPYSKSERARRAYRCLRNTGIPKDILVRTRAEFERFCHIPASLEHQIMEKGKILYG